MENRNGIPKDRRGRPLNLALLVKLFPVKGPPLIGRLLTIGPKVSTLESLEGEIHEARNSQLENWVEK